MLSSHDSQNDDHGDCTVVSVFMILILRIMKTRSTVKSRTIHRTIQERDPEVPMEIKQIAITDFVIEKPDADDRTFSRLFCENLALSIKSDGLLHEPIVRPISGQPGKVRPITGRNRIYACGKILRWERIPCKIAPDGLSDDEATAMQDAENLSRNDLSDAQTKKALIFWRKVYEAKHPAANGTGSSAEQAKIVEENVAEAEAKGSVVDPRASISSSGASDGKITTDDSVGRGRLASFPPSG
jgi:ParB-like nuclease domain